MKKTIFVALAAVSMIFASCGKKMSPEATKAWEDMKAKAASVCSMEAIDQFETVEDWNAAVKAFQAATQEMGKYQSEYSKEVIDSFTTLTTKFAEVNEKAAAQIQATMEQALEEAGVDGEEMLEEGEEELEPQMTEEEVEE